MRGVAPAPPRRAEAAPRLLLQVLRTPRPSLATSPRRGDISQLAFLGHATIASEKTDLDPALLQRQRNKLRFAIGAHDLQQCRAAAFLFELIDPFLKVGCVGNRLLCNFDDDVAGAEPLFGGG